MVNNIVIDDPTGSLEIDHTSCNMRQHVGYVDLCRGRYSKVQSCANSQNHDVVSIGRLFVV